MSLSPMMPMYHWHYLTQRWPYYTQLVQMRSAGTSGLAAILPRVTPHITMDVKDGRSISESAIRKKAISVDRPACQMPKNRVWLRSIQITVKIKAGRIEKGPMTAWMSKCDVPDMSHP